MNYEQFYDEINIDILKSFHSHEIEKNCNQLIFQLIKAII
jgi:hypothetical protein